MNTAHYAEKKIGILLMNLGTPDAPTPRAVRAYLAEFLSDPRVVEIPRLLWLAILHGIILRIRPRRSAALYQAIWTENGSPLQAYMAALTEKVRAHTDAQRGSHHPARLVDYAMRYGQPNVSTVLARFKAAGVRRLLVLPLYPHYSASTTASCVDAIAQHMQHERFLPEMRFISGYADSPLYIDAICQSIEQQRQAAGDLGHLIFSFHGLPQRNFDLGDPYSCFCHKTARLVAEQLGLDASQWQVCFQSRFGKATWLQPYLSETLEALPTAGTTHVTVVTPGFSCDCLETLEEIQVENRDRFLAAGGKRFDVVACLNDSPAQVNLLMALIQQHTQGW